MPKNAAVPERLDEFGESRNVGAARQELAEAPQEDHHGQRDEDRVRAGVGDHRPHHQARCSADADGQYGAEQEGIDAGVWAAIGLQHPRQSEPTEIGREGDREVDAARDDRHQHGQR